MNLDDLVRQQDLTAVELQKAIANYKKTPRERFSLEYVERKATELEKLWLTFQRMDNIIRREPSATEDHPYFAKDLYASIGQKYNEVAMDIEERISALKATESKKTAANQNTASTLAAAKQDSTVNIESSTKEDRTNGNIVTAISGRIRKQQVLINSCREALEQLLSGKENLSPQERAARFKGVEKHWQTAERLHGEIFDLMDTIDEQVYNVTRFIQTEAEINSSMARVQATFEDNTTSREKSVLYNPLPHLPRVELPKFDGSYPQWRQFHDLYLEMVHNQQIPACQKMWYLKTCLVGEAAKLILHFPTTAANYDAAWSVIKNRFENKRLLINSAINKLLATPSFHIDNASDVKTLHDNTVENLLMLKNLGIETTNWDPLLLQLLVPKLSKITHTLWEQSLTNPREIPTVSEFLNFLELRFQTLEALSPSQGQKERSSKVHTYVATDQGLAKCKVCNQQSHPLFACNQFQQMSENERLQFLRNNQLCINCMKSGHIAKYCKARTCSKCNKKHNTLVHFNNSVEQASNESAGATPSVSLAASKQNDRGYVLLGTVVVKLMNNNGQSIECRAILDSGSQINIITESAARRLGLKLKPTSMQVWGIGDGKREAQSRVNITLASRTSNFSARLEAFVLPTIIAQQPTHPFDTAKWDIPSHITLADPNFHNPGHIDVLLGAEMYHEYLTTGKITIGNSLPTLRNTVFGWMVVGKVADSQANPAICGVLTEADLNAQLERFWKTDEMTQPVPSLSPAEQRCEAHFVSNTCRDKTGRFNVRIPFEEPLTTLGESRQIAVQRFRSLERRFERDPILHRQYCIFMKEYKELGHMTEINWEDVMSPNYFIPHHCVIRPESSSTKLRVVFDASCKTSTGLALNDIMYKGPTIQNELFTTLLRFRMPRFVFTSDIQKMYRQIWVDPKDRQCQLIVWRESPREPLRCFQLNTVTYGTRCAPYLATKCLEVLSKDNETQHPLGAKALREDFYVDDCLSGSNNLFTAIETQKQLIKILDSAGLHLRKWCSNHPRLLQSIPVEDHEVNLDFDSEENETIKTLGMTWMPKSDQFRIKVNSEPPHGITKRSIVSEVAKVFDPLGLLAPVIVTAKILIQEIWELQLSWDDELPDNIQSKWVRYRSRLSELNNATFPRHVLPLNNQGSCQLHAFADASEKAYGAAIYIRSIGENGTISVRLLCAKSRVAPLKQQTIPRLELCAALLGAQLMARVTRDLNQLSAPVYYWTDSQIVLAWINSKSNSLHTFVANRVAAIQDLSSASQWRHVSSKDNPADVLSRGIGPTELSSCTVWLYGPTFLHGNQTCWPKEYDPTLSIEFTTETRPQKATVAINTNREDFLYNINHHNSFKSLTHIVGYVLRFINNTRKRKKEYMINLTTIEQKEALLAIIRAVQWSNFKDDIQAMNSNTEIQKGSNLAGLNVFIGSDGVIRVGGRLNAAAIPYDAKHPMVLPYNDSIVKLLMKQSHERNMHCGPQALLANVRQQFWPIKGKLMARSIVQKCVRCSRARPNMLTQIMGDLPSTRIQPARPFINSGVDFCGPFWIHYSIRGKRPVKAYVAVFCCFATKAVHLEIVANLTTEAFIGCLKRFIGRRGHCSNLYCDNATNFVGAKNQLSELSHSIHSQKAQHTIVQTCSDKGIQFHFIPPRAPHFGGLWEAAVKSAKHLFVRGVSQASMTYEELETVMIEIEAILNSRPLVEMSSNPNDLTALTPGHFLIGEALTAQVDPSSRAARGGLAERWKMVTKVKHEFWQRWTKEYLNELRFRQKWKEETDNAKPGMMVIIKEDNLPPLSWSLGRIVNVYKGDDGAVRVADIKTANGICTRPIRRLAPLPIQEDEPLPSTSKQHQEHTSNDEDAHQPKRAKRIHVVDKTLQGSNYYKQSRNTSTIPKKNITGS